LIGLPDSGKTSLLFSLFKSPKVYKDKFDKIYLFVPINSFNDVKNHPFDKNPKIDIFNEISKHLLNYVQENIKENSEDREFNSLIIIDDFGTNLKRKDNVPIFQKFIKHETLILDMKIVTLFYVVKTIY
jgi:uncharacterized protein (UPF0305 family)